MLRLSRSNIVCQKEWRRKIVSAAEKATIVDEMKSRDFNMDCVIEEEFAQLIHNV